MPEIQTMQVQYLVKYIVELMGVFVGQMGDAISNLGAGIAAESQNNDSMAELTTGIFGTNNGLLYWMNDYANNVLATLPYGEIGQGLHALLEGLRNGAGV